MKRILLFALLLLGINFAYAVQIDSTSVRIDSTIKTATDGETLLKSIAIGAGETMISGYEIVVKQQYVYAIQYLAVGISSFLFLILFLFFYYGRSQSTNSFTPSLIFFCLFVWSAIVFSMHFTQIVQAFVNPEYAAISDIVRLTKSLISK